MQTSTGIIVISKVAGKSALTRCFSKYPLKLIAPRKAAASTADAVWIYSLSYGGGIVSGDKISLMVTVDDGCTAVITTQASTKVYKSVDSKCSEQILEASVGMDGFLVVVPDPVTCFKTARYSQCQVFRVTTESNLVVVDWITSGRHESGEKWGFHFYRSTNHIFLQGDIPLFIDSVLLEEGSNMSIAESMHDYNVIGMVIIVGPKLKQIQSQIQDEVKQMMSDHFRAPSRTAGPYARSKPEKLPTKMPLIASCSSFGPKATGLVVRIAAVTTESVYVFLRHHLASLEPLIGAAPYR